MRILSSRYGIAICEEESVYGTDQVNADIVAGTNAFVYQPFTTCDITPVADQYEPDQLRGSASGIKHTQIPNHNTVSVTSPMRGKSAAAGTAPNWAPLLKAANFSETVSPGVSVTYAPSTAAVAGASFWKYERELESGDYRAIRAYGCRGSMSFDFAISTEATLTWDGMSASFDDFTPARSYFAVDGTPALDYSGGATGGANTASYPDKDRLICQNATVTIGGNSYPIASLSLDMAWSMSPVQVMLGSPTTSKVLLTRAAASRPNGTFQLVDGDTAYSDALADWQSSGEMAASLVFTNTTDTITFTIQKMQVGRPGPADVGGLRAWDIPFFLNGYSSLTGDDEVSVVFT